MEKSFTTNNVAHTASILIGAITIATGGMTAINSHSYTINSGKNSIVFGDRFDPGKSNSSQEYDFSLSFNSSKTDSEVITVNDIDWGRMQQSIETLTTSVDKLEQAINKLPTKEWVENEENKRALANYKKIIANIRWSVGIAVGVLAIAIPLIAKYLIK